MKKLLIYTIILIFISCTDRSIIWSSFQHPPMEGWELSRTLTFMSDTIKENGYYKPEIVIRTWSTYPYKSLWIRARLIQKDSIQTTMLNIDLNTKSRNGKDFAIREGSKNLPEIWMESGNLLQININHAMRTENIQNIADVGIFLRKGI